MLQLKYITIQPCDTGTTSKSYDLSLLYQCFNNVIRIIFSSKELWRNHRRHFPVEEHGASMNTISAISFSRHIPGSRVVFTILAIAEGVVELEVSRPILAKLPRNCQRRSCMMSWAIISPLLSLSCTGMLSLAPKDWFIWDVIANVFLPFPAQ